MTSTLISRNVTVNGHRTSIRLEPEMWDAMDEVCALQRVTMHEFCSLVERERRASSLTAGVRVALLGYFREASKGEHIAMAMRPQPAARAAASA